MLISEYLKDNKYPGRILIGGTACDGKPVVVYAVTGRSEKSRNRILISDKGCLRTQLLSDITDGDELTIYRASWDIPGYRITANGSHGEDIAEALKSGKSLLESLDSLSPEPDAAATPRIALVSDCSDGTYSLAIVRKDADGNDERIVWKYQNTPGFGHIIHTYDNDGEPLPAFSSDPAVINLMDSLSEFSAELWKALDKDNKVAMYLGYEGAERIINARVH